MLAGGRSRRFGSDKCRHVYRGRSLLDHALAGLADASDLMVVGAQAPDGSRAKSVPDLRPGLGPLGGLHAALSAARYAWVAVTACDMPFVEPKLWPYLLARAEDALMVIPTSGSGPEPLAGVYHRDLIPTLEESLDRGRLSLRELPKSVPSRLVPWADVREVMSAAAFVNANRAEDLP